MTSLLRDFWYVAIPARQLKVGQLVSKKILGEPIVLGRLRGGKVFALRNICPHRGVPLHYGCLEGEAIACCYHGWKFSAKDGRCLEIPSLTEKTNFDFSRIGVFAYPCREIQGHIWVFIPENLKKQIEPHKLPPVPSIPALGQSQPGLTEHIGFDCNIDQAVIGLMDPAHGPYIHTSWWWRSGPRRFRIKQKCYEPIPMGFRLVPYQMPTCAKPYKLLGKQVSIEIIFQLPSLRTEILRGDRHTACLFTAITPIDENKCHLFQSLYWTIPWMGMFKPILCYFTRQFLRQDRDVVIKQKEGLAYDPCMMLIDDADTQAKWYFQLKQEYQRSQREARPFKNPVRAKRLSWRS